MTEGAYWPIHLIVVGTVKELPGGAPVTHVGTGEVHVVE
jgi:hypothetical protein